MHEHKATLDRTIRSMSIHNHCLLQ